MEKLVGNIKGPKGDKGDKGDTGEQGLKGDKGDIGADYQPPVGGIPKNDLSAAVQTSLGKADTALQTETDPTVPAWAKATSKPTYTAIEVGAEPAFTKNTAFNNNFGTATGTVCEGDDTRLSNARPASDVSAWAKAAEKPAYTASEVGAEPAFTQNTAFNKNFGMVAETVCEGNDARLTDARIPTAHTHGNADLSELGAWAKTANKPAYSASEVGALPTTGGAVTGAMTVLAPTADMNPTPKKYVDDKFAAATAGVSSIKGNAESTYRTGNVNLTAENVGAEPSFTKNGAFNKSFGTMADTVCEGDDSRLSNSRPASDVSAWAKETTKPTYTAGEIGAEPAFTKNGAFNKSFGITAGTVCEGNDTRLTNPRTPTAHTHGNADLNELGTWAKTVAKPTYAASEVGAEPAFTKNGAFNKNFGTATGTVCEGNDSRLSNSRPASDVSAWAKETTKPTYTASEVGAEPAFTKNTGFNKNFGTAAGTVCQGNDSRLNSLSSIVDYIYPVGSILTTEDANFNPNTKYTGTTWTELKDHVLYARSSTDTNLQTVGAIGGNNDAATIAHTHSGPSHTHTGTSDSTTPGATGSSGSHTHGFSPHISFRRSGGASYTPHNVFNAADNWRSDDGNEATESFISNGGAHTHTSVAHTHGFTTGASGTGNTGSTGEPATRRNMMKYKVVIMWKRTA